MKSIFVEVMLSFRGPSVRWIITEDYFDIFSYH